MQNEEDWRENYYRKQYSEVLTRLDNSAVVIFVLTVISVVVMLILPTDSTTQMFFAGCSFILFISNIAFYLVLSNYSQPED